MSRTAETDIDAFEQVLEAFRAGDPVLIHDFDDREGETDLVYPAGAVAPAAVARMRNDAGGLICVALADDVADALSLPFMDDVLDHPATASHDLAYDSRSSFSFTVNHRDSFTGITDSDRAMTISRLAPVAEATRAGEYDAADFGSEFRAPGHVHLLRGAPNLLDDRQGHTELGLALADEVGIPPAVVVCEMLDDHSGSALSVAAARNYADRYDLAFIDGDRLLDELA